MPESALLRRDSGAVVLTPGAQDVPESAGPGTLVLEVAGGHLCWSLLAGARIPVAVLFDPAGAQDWLWAVYGERVALAVAEEASGDFPVHPALADLVDGARQLAYAHWADRWWPASTVDGIPALDRRLLGAEIADLTEVCDLLVDGSDAQAPAAVSSLVEVTGRARDYALAAGAASASTGLILAAGTTGWDWRRCPPGLLDASEHAVSWQLFRDSGTSTVRVRAVAAPDLDTEPPEHLRPYAHIVTTSATADLALIRTGDSWAGATGINSDDITGVDIHVPGVGPADPDTAGGEHGPRMRQQIRDFAANRLRAAPGIAPVPLLRSEITAAASDPDF